MTKHFLLISGQDLKLAFWRKGFFFHILTVFLIINFILNFILSNYSPGYLGNLIALIFSSSILGNYLIKEDYKNFYLHQLILSGSSPLLITLAKIFSFLLIIFTCGIIGIICQYFQNNNLVNISPIFIIFFLISFVLALISTFSSLLTAKIPHAEIINIIIIFPLSFSFLIYAASIFSITSLEIIYNEIKLLSGIILAVAPLILWGCSICLTRI